jgi:type IV pilus assembly protein PilM
MQRVSLVDQLRYKLTAPQYPEIGIEFNSNAIRIAEVTSERGNLAIHHLDAEAIPPGTMDINPFKPNIHAIDSAARALKELWTRNRLRPSRVCLLLQDRSALTFQVTLEHAASNAKECLDLIKFKLKKNVPFRIEEARVFYFTPAGVPDRPEINLWVTIMHHSVIEQYEQFVQSAIECNCGLVDLSTFNLINLAHPQVRADQLQDADLLFVNLNVNYISIAISQKGKLAFYRSRPLERQNGVFDEALAEIHPTTMFYLDKLSGTGLARAFVYSYANVGALVSEIEREFEVKATPLTVHGFGGAAASDPDVGAFAPLIGLIASRKVEFL